MWRWALLAWLVRKIKHLGLLHLRSNAPSSNQRGASFPSSRKGGKVSLYSLLPPYSIYCTLAFAVCVVGSDPELRATLDECQLASKNLVLLSSDATPIVVHLSSQAPVILPNFDVLYLQKAFVDVFVKSHASCVQTCLLCTVL